MFFSCVSDLSFSFFMFSQESTPARADALQQSWMEEAQTFLTRSSAESTFLLVYGSLEQTQNSKNTKTSSRKS